PDRLAAGAALRRPAPGLPGRAVGGFFLVRAVDGAGAVCAAHVRDHWFLPPLFFPQGLPHLATGAVLLRPGRGGVGAARATVVGSASSPPPPPRRHRTRRAFAAARFPAQPYGLVPDPALVRHRPRGRARPGPVPGAAPARPLRHPGAGAA